MGHWIPTYSLLKIDVLPILLNSTQLYGEKLSNLLTILSFSFPFTWLIFTIFDINFTNQTVGYKRKCKILQQCITNIFAQQYVLCKNEKILLHLLIPFIICLNSLKFNSNQLYWTTFQRLHVKNIQTLPAIQYIHAMYNKISANHNRAQNIAIILD